MHQYLMQIIVVFDFTIISKLASGLSHSYDAQTPEFLIIQI